MLKMDKILNHFKIRKFKDNILLVTEQGNWVVLTKKEYDDFICGDVNSNKKLDDLGLLIDKTNFEKIVAKQKSLYSQLFCGTSLHIVVPTLRCNLKCDYCHSRAKSESVSGYDMDEETARKTVDFIFQTPSKQVKIEFQGGEPLLNFDIVKYVIGYAEELNKDKKKDLKFALVTNLIKMDDDKLKYLIEHNVGLCTSLDGPKNVHDILRKRYSGAGSYDSVVSWIKTIHEQYKYPLAALMVTTKWSLDYPREIIDEYLKLGFDRIQIKFLSNLGNAQKVWGDISYSAEEYLTFWRAAIDYMVELNVEGGVIHESITTYILKKILTDEPNVFVDLQSPCGAVINQLAYDCKGDIYTCDEGRQYELFKLGNVGQGKFNQVCTSDEASAIIAASVNDCFLCDACVYKPYCGLCPVCCYAESGTLVPKLAMNDRCKILKGMFDYIFEKLIFSEDHKRVFNEWAKQGNK
jgi:His-Xaa-Ser system radical SAM maturase HxsB